jgi:hypothetical protein
MALIKEYIALQGLPSTQSFTLAVSEAMPKGAVRVLCDKAKSYVVYQRPADKDELLQTEASEVYGVIRQREIIDLPLENQSFHKNLHDLFMSLNDRNLYPSFVLIKEKRLLRNLLGLPRTLPIDLLFGAKVIEHAELEDDVILVAGSNVRNAEAMDIVISIKGYLDAR